jgi:DNA-directed RNA polymerase beta' subunit
MLDFIQPQKGIPIESAMSIVRINKDKLRAQLVGQKVYPAVIPALAQKIKDMYFATQIQPGECVGILTAQSIGEKQTQGNLNNFHKAGSAENEVNVVSKFSELLNATKSKDVKSKSSMIYFNGGNGTIEELRRTIGDTIVQLTIEKIIRSDQKEEPFLIYVDKEDEPWYPAFEALYNSDFRQYTDCISIKIDMDKLYMYRLTLEDIVNRIFEEYGDLACVFSPDNIGQIDVFIDTQTIELPESRIDFVDADNMKEVYLEEVVLPIFRKITIAGIDGINQMFFARDTDNGGWMIETDGANFPMILAHPAVDMARCVTSCIWDVYTTLGIEAVRQFMIEQFMELMGGINICHTMLLVDRMTCLGTISSISRYTMRKAESGPLGKASFEETLDNFLKAGLYGQTEPTRGVSASIICGKRIGVGSGLCDVTMDISSLPVVEEEPEEEYRPRSRRRRRRRDE